MDISDAKLLIFLGVYLLINIFSFIYVMIDKQRAFRNHERTPEGKIFFSAVCFGALGVWIGMFIFHHKTQKWYFYIGMPLLVIQNLVFLYFLWLNFFV